MAHVRDVQCFSFHSPRHVSVGPPKGPGAPIRQELEAVPAVVRATERYGCHETVTFKIRDEREVNKISGEKVDSARQSNKVDFWIQAQVIIIAMTCNRSYLYVTREMNHG